MIVVHPLSPGEAEARRREAAYGASPVRLDSAAHASPWSRWSYAPGPALLLLEADAGTGVATLRDGGGVVRSWPDPLAALACLAAAASEAVPAGIAPPGPPFKGGWVGFLSYDLGRWFEAPPAPAATDPAGDPAAPLFRFTFHDRVLAWDAHAAAPAPAAYECSLPGYACPGVGLSVGPRAVPIALRFPPAYHVRPSPPRSNFTRPQYEAAVRRAIDYIAAGDIFQVNLAQCFTAGLPDAPAAIYDRLRRRFPAWFGALLDYGDLALLCNSPELFLRMTPDPATGDRRVLTRPIKGTRPRSAGGAADSDAGMAEELRRSPKDQAELNMIVDLERNDLGRVCRIGSVKVSQPRAIEAHPTVLHGVATVEGDLRPEVTWVDLLVATFPGGSVTGAPKIRATQIIDELEPARRGPYCGAIGYLSADGHAQFNLAIRTMLARGDRIHIPVGGGIVADSVPGEEYEETLVKARAMLAALEG